MLVLPLRVAVLAAGVEGVLLQWTWAWSSMTGKAEARASMAGHGSGLDSLSVVVELVMEVDFLPGQGMAS